MVFITIHFANYDFDLFYSTQYHCLHAPFSENTLLEKTKYAAMYLPGNTPTQENSIFLSDLFGKIPSTLFWMKTIITWFTANPTGLVKIYPQIIRPMKFLQILN